MLRMGQEEWARTGSRYRALSRHRVPGAAGDRAGRCLQAQSSMREQLRDVSQSMKSSSVRSAGWARSRPAPCIPQHQAEMEKTRWVGTSPAARCRHLPVAGYSPAVPLQRCLESLVMGCLTLLCQGPALWHLSGLFQVGWGSRPGLALLRQGRMDRQCSGPEHGGQGSPQRGAQCCEDLLLLEEGWFPRLSPVPKSKHPLHMSQILPVGCLGGSGPPELLFLWRSPGPAYDQGRP